VQVGQTHTHTHQKQTSDTVVSRDYYFPLWEGKKVKEIAVCSGSLSYEHGKLVSASTVTLTL